MRWLAWVLCVSVAQAATPVLEIDSSRFPEVHVTLNLPAEKITKDLLLDDVKVREDGQACVVSKYATLDSVALVLVVERGPGVKKVLPELVAAAQRMVRALGKGPPASLIVAGEPGERVVALTRSRGKLESALDELTAQGGVRLVPALRMALEEMARVEARTKVVLVLTAGHDMDAKGRKLPEDPELEKVLERAKKDGLAFRFLTFGGDVDRKRIESIGEVLKDPSAHEMQLIYGDPIPRVRFDLTYSSPRPTDFSMRKVAVEFRMFGFEGEVQGYYGDQGKAAVPAGGGSAARTPVETPEASVAPLLESEPDPAAAEPASGAQSETGQPRSLTLPGQQEPPKADE